MVYALQYRPIKFSTRLKKKVDFGHGAKKIKQMSKFIKSIAQVKL